MSAKWIGDKLEPQLEVRAANAVGYAAVLEAPFVR